MSITLAGMFYQLFLSLKQPLECIDISYTMKKSESRKNTSNSRKCFILRLFTLFTSVPLTAILLTPHALRRLNCSLFYLIGLWKHVQCLIGLRELINSYCLCFASTNWNLSLQQQTNALSLMEANRIDFID